MGLSYHYFRYYFRGLFINEMNMQKGFTLLIFVLIIGVLSVGIVGGSFWYKNYKNSTKDNFKPRVEQNQKQENSDWKLYTNSSYGFSVNYPPDWTAVEGPNDYYYKVIASFYPRGVQPGIWEKVENSMPGSDPHITVVLRPQPISKSRAFDPELLPDRMDFEKISVGGIEGYYYWIINCAPVCPKFFELPYKENSTLQFTLLSMGQENIDIFNEENKLNISDADEVTFRKMIKTFKLSEARKISKTKVF